uniref:hypothetical protein n=1 Tax=Alistipes putredinis TaxID=28117 RepID=UPI003AB7E745
PKVFSTDHDRTGQRPAPDLIAADHHIAALGGKLPLHIKRRMFDHRHITIRLRLKQTICMAFSQNTGVNIKIIL